MATLHPGVSTDTLNSDTGTAYPVWLIWRSGVQTSEWPQSFRKKWISSRGVTTLAMFETRTRSPTGAALPPTNFAARPGGGHDPPVVIGAARAPNDQRPFPLHALRGYLRHDEPRPQWQRNGYVSLHTVFRINSVRTVPRSDTEWRRVPGQIAWDRP